MSTVVAVESAIMVEPRDWKRSFAQGEDVLLAALLGVMVLVPISEVVLRRMGHSGIAGSMTIVQHSTLLLSMLGAAIAARQSRLLTIGTDALLPARIRPFAAFIATTGAAAVAALLCIGSARFVIAEREGGRVLLWGLQEWVVEMALPVGFGLICARLVVGSSSRWPGRVIASCVAGAAVACGTLSSIPTGSMKIGGIIGVALMTAAGAPIFAVIGGAALVGHLATEIPIASLAVSHYSLVVNPSLPAIPLFTLAGYVLADGGASRRLVRLFDAVVGGVRGGPAVVTVLACAFFTTFTGGSGVTILALGGLLLPILTKARYSERNALGLLTGAGALGILFPPCLPLILYAIAANVDVKRLFIAGIVPGILLLLLIAILGWVQQPAGNSPRTFDAPEMARALWDAKWEVLLPCVVLVVLLGGIATPVEAAAITALYALVIEVVVHRSYREPSQLLTVFTNCGLLVGGVLLVLGVALGLTAFLVDAEVPQRTVDWVTATVDSPIVFLLLLNLFLVVVGALMDIYSAIVVVVPLIVPLGVAFGIDPIHLGIIFLTNLELGYLVPPVGENLFIAAYRFDKPVGELARAVLPVVGVLLVGVLAVTYVPALSLWLVGHLN